MKTRITRRMFAAVVIPVMTLLSGCHVHEEPCYYGYDGASGRAFFALEWTQDQPEYLWTDNTAIPHIFQYGAYYQSAPGHFELYYEGEFYEDCCPKFYYWDVHFDVWTHAGTPGGCGFNGTHGADSYLMMLCGPYGPVETRTNKTTADGTTVTIVSQTDDEIVAEIHDGELIMRATYTRLKESRKAELDPKGEIIAR